MDNLGGNRAARNSLPASTQQPHHRPDWAMRSRHSSHSRSRSRSHSHVRTPKKEKRKAINRIFELIVIQRQQFFLGFSLPKFPEIRIIHKINFESLNFSIQEKNVFKPNQAHCLLERCSRFDEPDLRFEKIALSHMTSAVQRHRDFLLEVLVSLSLDKAA